MYGESERMFLEMPEAILISLRGENAPKHNFREQQLTNLVLRR